MRQRENVAAVPVDSESVSAGLADREELPTAQQVEAAVATLTMLADGTRLQLLYLLTKAERDVGTLARMIDTTPGAASQHLAKLRLAGLVSVRREGRHHVYAARGAHVRQLIAEALFHADHRVAGTPDHD